MTQTLNVSTSSVVTALGNTERFPEGSPQFEIFAPYIGHLIDIVGEDHLDDHVGPANLCDVTARFIRWLAGNEGFIGALGLEGSMVASLYKSLAGQLDDFTEDPDALLAQLGITEAEAMEMEQLGLDETSKQLYRSGHLTFAALLTTSPDVLIPRT